MCCGAHRHGEGQRWLASEPTCSPRALESCVSAGLELLKRRLSCQSSVCASRDARRALSAHESSLEPQAANKLAYVRS